MKSPSITADYAHDELFDSSGAILLPIQQEIIELFFAEEVIRNAKDGGENSWKTIEGYISAVVKLHDESGCSLSEGNKLRLHQFKKGKRNDRAKQMSKGLIEDIKEARDPISADLLRIISKLALQESSTFFHLFSLLMWNLIARGDNVNTFHLRHISWSGIHYMYLLNCHLTLIFLADSMNVFYVREKRYPGGDMVEYFRSLYANINEPEVCVISAMALHIICNPDITGNLWNKNFANKAFSNWLSQKADDLKRHPTYACLMEHFKFGLHSYRKGGATYCGASEQCPVLALFLRACWYLGGEIDRYVFHSDGGDKKVGRIAALLEEGSPDFSSIPPRFNIHDEAFQSFIKWELILPRYREYPNTFKIAVPFLIAMAVYRNNWWEKILPAEHSYFKSWFYTNQWYLKLKSYVLDPVNFICPITKITATGVPVSDRVIQTLRGEIVSLKTFVESNSTPSYNPRRNDPITFGDVNDMFDRETTNFWKLFNLSLVNFKILSNQALKK